MGHKRTSSLVSGDNGTRVFLGRLLICRGTHHDLALGITMLHTEDSRRITASFQENKLQSGGNSQQPQEDPPCPVLQEKRLFKGQEKPHLH